MLLAGITNAWWAFQLMHLAERKSVITYYYKPNTDKASAEGNVRRTRISSAGGDVEEVATASVTRRKRKEPDAITVERRQKNRAIYDSSEDNNTETEDEGDARAQPKPQKPAKPAAARATKPSAKARKPSRPVAKKIWS